MGRGCNSLQNVGKIVFFGGFLVPLRVVSMNKSGEDFFGKIDFGHFFCPIFKTQNTLCQKIF